MLQSQCHNMLVNLGNLYYQRLKSGGDGYSLEMVTITLAQPVVGVPTDHDTARSFHLREGSHLNSQLLLFP